ncbi:MAG: LysR family transcriptional regulator [Proteobacteria bacterium]|jgi:DNA-binding transcriptional LysR family regulator|nr:LysR family transcriptional regulator [Pseudomonadota bacterium]
MNWDKLRIFHSVASVGSFTRAGNDLGLSQSAVSRQIRTLEENLQTTLFNRHARGLILTDEGETLFQTTSEVISKIHVTEQRILEGREIPRGNLRVTTSSSFGSTWLMRNIRKFIEKHPEINIQMLVGDDTLDLLTRQADVAIRFQPSEHLDLIQKAVGTFHHHIYASPEYLNRRGRPKSARDLDNHDIITYGELATSPIRNINWIQEIDAVKKRQPILEVNSIYGVLQGVKSGLGIAALPDYIVQGSTNVKRILEDLEGPEFTSYIVYTSDLRKSNRISAFRDFIVEEFKKASF